MMQGCCTPCWRRIPATEHVSIVYQTTSLNEEEKEIFAQKTQTEAVRQPLSRMKNRKNQTKSTPSTPTRAPGLLPQAKFLQNLLRNFVLPSLADILKKSRQTAREDRNPQSAFSTPGALSRSPPEPRRGKQHGSKHPHILHANIRKNGTLIFRDFHGDLPFPLFEDGGSGKSTVLECGRMSADLRKRPVIASVISMFKDEGFWIDDQRQQ